MPGTLAKDRGGAYTDLRELIQLRYAAKEINHAAAKKSRNPLSGLLTSSFRGRGIDFAEVRVYQPGDDIRSIDWRVTARTEIPHTKLFQEEKERPVLLLVDQSRPMFFGSRHAFKSVVAAKAAALLAWTALDRGDRTGGIVFSEAGHREIRPRRNKHAVLQLLSEIDSLNHALNREPVESPTNGLVQALRNVRRVAKHGSSIFVISDFAFFDDDALLHFNQLSRHNDIVGVHISDPMEHQLPKPDLYTITNGDARVRINAANRHFRTKHREQFAARIAWLRTELGKLRSPLLELGTAEPVVASLVQKYNEYMAWQRMRR